MSRVAGLKALPSEDDRGLKRGRNCGAREDPETYAESHGGACGVECSAEWERR
jgi:hypothetical protein